MKVFLDELDFCFFLDPDVQELRRLLKSEITTSLQEFRTERDLGKKVRFRIGETESKSGIDFIFFPEDAKNLQESLGLEVTINYFIFDLLNTHGIVFSNYLDGKNKVKIFYSRPPIYS